VNIPPIISIENALKIYYSNSELGNREITALFGRRSSATVSRLKRIVKDEMDKKDLFSYGANKVNTEIAFNVWGINVASLERRMKKLKELNL
jgi:hypothetical protein